MPGKSALRRKARQTILQRRMGRDRPFRCVGLQVPQPIGGSDRDEQTEVALGDQIVPQKPRRLPGAHAGEKTEEQSVPELRVAVAQEQAQADPRRRPCFAARPSRGSLLAASGRFSPSSPQPSSSGFRNKILQIGLVK